MVRAPMRCFLPAVGGLLLALLPLQSAAQQISYGQPGAGTLGASSLTINSVNSTLSKSLAIYAPSVTTFSAGVYTAAKGALRLPTTLTSGQVYVIQFNVGNTGSATLKIGSFAEKSIKILDSAGAALTLTGGEIVPGVATVCYNGTEYILRCSQDSRSVAVVGSTTLTQANFSNRDTYYLAAGAQTITLPCSSTLSSNGQVYLFSVNGIITVDVTGGCTPSDGITKNGASGASTTIAQGAAIAAVLTNANGNFYLSGQ